MYRVNTRLVVAIVVAGFLLVAGGRAQAVIGVPDDVPAATLLYPFFKVNPKPTATTRQDTLVVVSNTANPPAAFTAAGVPAATAHTWVHFTIWTTKSIHVLDFSVLLTARDVWSCSLLDLLVNPNNIPQPCGISQAPPIALTALAVGDILAGYVTVDVVAGPTSLFPGQVGYPFSNWNTLIGHLYLVDLPAGSATGFNAVSIESANKAVVTTALDTVVVPPTASNKTVTLDPSAIGKPATAGDLSQLGFYLNRCLEEQGGGTTTPCFPNLFLASPYGNRERIDGFSGDLVDTFNGGRTGAVQFGYPPANVFGDSPLSLIVRYFTLSALNGSTEIWLWKDRVTATTSLTFAVYDEDENVQSVSFVVGDEVNFTKLSQVISANFPGGWIRIKFTCALFGYCGYNPFDPAGGGTGTPVPPITAPTTSFQATTDVAWITAGGVLQTPIQAVAYSLQFANSQDAKLRWDAAFAAHRQYTNYIGGTAAE